MSSLKKLIVIVAGFLVLCSIPEVQAQSRSKKQYKTRKVEAVKGKRYKLHPAHGPWMIMVTTLRDVEPGLRTEGLSAWEAADEIIYQLRKQGLPAYAFHQKEETGQLASARATSPNSGKYVARQEYIAILAGNFSSSSDRRIKPCLKYVQKYRPDLLDRDDTGVVQVSASQSAAPFQRAFVVPNPLRSKDDLGVTEVDPLIKRLNSGTGDISLLKNPGRFSLKVATFRGGAATILSGTEGSRQEKHFNENFGKGIGRAGASAWELATALRRAGKLGYGQDYEAWVYHDEHNSYVMVGSFDSPHDPRINQLKDAFNAKMKPDPKTGTLKKTPELMSIPKNPVGATLPDKLWFFDSEPQVVAVPGR